MIIETVSCFKRKLFELQSLIHLTASVYCTHPSSCAARGLRDSLERFLAYSSSIFILKHKQQDEELSAAWLKGGQTETASVVGRKYFNTNTFLTGILKKSNTGHSSDPRASAAQPSPCFALQQFVFRAALHAFIVRFTHFRPGLRSAPVAVFVPSVTFTTSHLPATPE